MTPQEIFAQYSSRQRISIPTIQNYGKLSNRDMKRIDNQLQGRDIFQTQHCVLHPSGKANVFVSFRYKKVTLQRLLYHNYCDDLPTHKQLKLSCQNSSCCTLAHFVVPI